MPKKVNFILLWALIFCLPAGQATAFDLQIGPSHFGTPPVEASGYRQDAHKGFGAQITIPLGGSRSETVADTLNGQDMSRFTKQDAKDSAIVIMFFGVAIAAGAVTVSAASN